MASAQIAAVLSREFGGRSVAAVRVRAGALGVSLEHREWSLWRLSTLFGANWLTIRQAWLETGLLPHRRLPNGQQSRRGAYLVREADLETFIRTCSYAYVAERMGPRGHPLVRLALAIQQRDRWLESDAVCGYLGMSHAAFQRWCERGVIPHQRRHVGVQGGVHGHIVVRAADLVGLGDVIREARQRGKRRRIDNLLAAQRARRAVLEEEEAA